MKTRLMRGDCLTMADKIPDGSIDLVLCDLPYGTTRLSWDLVIPLEQLWDMYRRVCSKTATIVLFGSQPFSSSLISSNLKWFKYEWVWAKSRPTGFAHAKNAPLKQHENILVFSRGVANHKGRSLNRMTYNPQGTTDTRILRNQSSGTIGKSRSCFSVSKNQVLKDVHIQTTTGYPRSVLEFSSQSNTVHPTQKPVALCEYLIRTYSDEGQTVLDNTMGSGTTGVACVNTNRHFIGIEKDRDYFQVARQRIKDARQFTTVDIKKHNTRSLF